MPSLFSFPSRAQSGKKSKLLPFQLRLPTSVVEHPGSSSKLHPFQLSSPTTGSLPPISEQSHANLSGPSHSAWQTAGNGGSSPVLPKHVVERSASTPEPSSIPFPSGPPPTRRGRSHSLKVDNSRRSGLSAKPLSPIEEQEYLSPEKRTLRLPSDGMDATQSRTVDGQDIRAPDASRLSPFAVRSLSRSPSQRSSRSLNSTSASASTAPSIPPLDLRPQFPSPSLRATKPAAAKVLPTIVDDDFSRDDSSDSWVTATSENPRVARGTASAQNSHAGHGSIISSSSSFVDRRWLDDASANMTDHEAFQLEVADAPKPRRGTTRACVLFWIGFIAPWCWLIGGWLPAVDSGHKMPKRKELVLPKWRTMAEKEEKGSQGIALGYPFVAPSLESLGKSSVVTIVQMQPTRIKVPDALDPWIHRCRVAAATSGLLLTVALILCFIVVGRK